MHNLKEVQIGIIGLGYVGLPLAVEFSKKFDVVGFDINEGRVNQLNKGIDSTLEVSKESLLNAKRLKLSSKQSELKNCNVYVVTVPTPIDKNKAPDLSPLISASEMLGAVLNVNDIVIYESTVYPGATEEDCVPVLEKVSSLKFNKDFFVGYSPERINPGDKARTVANILKVTSGSTPEVADFVDDLYKSIITAGTFKASSIKVAEAAKVIENTQRDINIALVNEFSLIFEKIGIETQNVLEAAATKWNFLKFSPGLVGGHCIGVDPYNLLHKAKAKGYHPDIIASSRKINDGMGIHIANKLVLGMVKKSITVVNSNVLVMGYTFKENCPDVRNTKVVDIITELQNFNVNVDVYDPWVAKSDSDKLDNINFLESITEKHYDSVVISVAHGEFKEIGMNKIISYCKATRVIFDLKNIFPKELSDLRL